MISLKTLTKHLIEHISHSTSEEFNIWKMVWISANGELDRKKIIDINVITEYYQCESQNIDSYKLSFAIETAIVSFSILLKNRYCEVRYPNIAFKRTATETLFMWAYSNEDLNIRNSYDEIIKQIISIGGAAQIYELVLTDVMRDLYHGLFPKAVRHTMGAYFSPGSLCDRIIEEHNVVRNLFGTKQKILEPNYGMGAFLLSIIREINKSFNNNTQKLAEAEKSLGRNFAGIEKNLGSYVVGRNVGIIALNYFRVEQRQIFEPSIYWGDSIYIDTRRIDSTSGHIANASNSTKFLVSNCLISNVPFEENTLHESASNFDGILIEELLSSKNFKWCDCGSTFKIEFKESRLELLKLIIESGVRDLVSIERLGAFDLIIGNPPWINWENIDPIYRDRILPMWPRLGLFAMAGRDRAFSKEDISVLATYAVMARFGKLGTEMGFLVPQSIFQSRKNSKGFRRFRLSELGLYLNIKHVVDYSAYAEFGDAKNRTAQLSCVLSTVPTKYPVSYEVAQVSGKKRERYIGSFIKKFARPSLTSEIDGNWAIFDDHSSEAKTSEIPLGAYRGRTGVFTGGANAIFYVETQSQTDCEVTVRNLTERAKVKVPDQEFVIEMAFLFPFNRGRDLQFWKIDRPISLGIILPHTLETKIKPVRRDVLAKLAPKTLSYLSQFNDILSSRPSLTAMDRVNVAEAPYAVLRVGDYTFKPYKVAWKYISKDFCCAVIGPQMISGQQKPPILQEKLISIGLDTEIEAFYVCGLLSSSDIKAEIERRIVGTQVSAHVIEDIPIIPFDPNSEISISIANRCREGHKMAKNGQPLSDIRTIIDELVRKLYVNWSADIKTLCQPELF